MLKRELYLSLYLIQVLWSRDDKAVTFYLNMETVKNNKVCYMCKIACEGASVVKHDELLVKPKI